MSVHNLRRSPFRNLLGRKKRRKVNARRFLQSLCPRPVERLAGRARHRNGARLSQPQHAALRIASHPSPPASVAVVRAARGTRALRTFSGSHYYLADASFKAFVLVSLSALPELCAAGTERGLSQTAARRQTDRHRTISSRLLFFHPLRVGTTRAPS